MNRNRTSARVSRRQTKNSEKTADIVNGTSEILSQNGFDEFDMMFGNCRNKLYPIIPPNRKGYTHNLADIPSLQSDEDSTLGIDNASQNSESNERIITPRKQYGKRRNANSLIESRNKFRQLLGQMQSKLRPNSNNCTNNKNDSAFDGYELKSRRVRYQPRKSNKDEQFSPSKLSSNEFCVKMFEKTIDLSGYCRLNPNQYIPLYPICRLWARNNYGLAESFKNKRNPPPPPLNECPDPDGPYPDGPVDVIHLPKPEPLPKDEDGNPIILRIPEKVRQKKNQKIEDTSFIDSLKHMTRQELLDLNMQTWKQARKENIEALRQNERRYRHSFSVLKSIFDKANNGEAGTDLAFYKYPPYESDGHNESHNDEKEPETLPVPQPESQSEPPIQE